MPHSLPIPISLIMRAYFLASWPRVIAPRRWVACLLWVKTGKARCEHMFSALPLKADVAQRGRHVRFVPMNETARAVGRYGVGRGRANNGWSDKASYVTWRRRTKEHPQAWRTLGKSIVQSTIKDIAHAEGVASRHLHHERSVLKNRTGAIGDAAVTASDV